MKSRYLLFRPYRLVQCLHSRQCSLVLFLCFCTCLLQYCQPRHADGEHTDVRAQNSSQENMFEDQLVVQYATGFDITYHDTYKILHLLLAQNTTRDSIRDSISYLLLPTGASPPENVKADQIIHIPVRKLITQSTTHIGLVSFLQAENMIIGIDEASYVYNPEIQQLVAEGKIQEVGSGESLNREMILALSPDLLMVSGMPGTALERYQPLIEVGIPVLVNTEWMESSLLAKAEWVKLIAALTNQEKTAREKFSSIVHQYDSVAALAVHAKDKPCLITGSPFQGTWYVPGEKSYRSQLFQQAGAILPWSGDSSAVSLPIDFETMYAYGQKADFWLNPGQVNSRQELLSKDARFADFKAFRQDRIYNNNKRMNEQGLGNDYFESGIVHPHLILSDVVKILHPALLPDYELFYYKKMN